MHARNGTNDGTDLRQRLEELSHVLGLDFTRARRVLCALTQAGSATVADLVEQTLVPYRAVVQILEWLGFSRDEDTASPSPAQASELVDILDCGNPSRPETILSQVTEIAMDLPPSVWNLDQVPATPETIAQRAQYFNTRYFLDRLTVLCVGDHDLMSVALTLANPDVRAVVVDIDERLLEYLDEVARQHRLAIKLFFCDLRLGLPHSVRASANLAFTDPPYTPEGVELFVRRSLEGLQPAGAGRVALCYGVADGYLDRVLDVQRRMSRLRVIIEALLPRFNRYSGAHAIGASSDLWILRPTHRTAAALDDANELPARIYSRGRSSSESSTDRLPTTVLTLLRSEIARVSGRAHIVGEGLEDLETSGTAERMSFPKFWQVVAAPVGRIPADFFVLNLGRTYGDSLLRLLMALPEACQAIVIVDKRALVASELLKGGEISRLINSRFAVEELLRDKTQEMGALRITTATSFLDDDAEVLRYAQNHYKALLRNALREGLIAYIRRRGGTLSKNQARKAIEETLGKDYYLDARLIELPLFALRRLPAWANSLTVAASASSPRNAPT